MQQFQNIWETKYVKSDFDHICHPEYQFDESALSCISSFLDSIDDGVDVVACHYEIRVISDAEEDNAIQFRCNFNFRGGPWFDWVNIEWTRGREERKHICLGLIYLWMSYHPSNHIPHVRREIYGLIHSVKNYIPPKYQYLPT